MEYGILSQVLTSNPSRVPFTASHNKSTVPTHKRFVEVFVEVRRENHGAVVLCESLRKISHFDIRIAIVCIPNLGAFAKQCVGLIKEKNRIANNYSSRML